jgi:hypothetical protein
MTTASLPEFQREAMLVHLDSVSEAGHDIGYGVGDDMAHLIATHLGS